MMCTNNLIHYGPIVVFLCLHITLPNHHHHHHHHYADLSHWKYWTYKMLLRYILSSVFLRLSQFSQLSFMLCVFNLPTSLVMIVKICVFYLIIIIKSECMYVWQWEALTWWCHVMEMLSALLALCEGNSHVTSGFPSQMANNGGLWYFLWCSTEQAVEPTIFFSAVWEAMMVTWPHGNDNNIQ